MGVAPTHSRKDSSMTKTQRTVRIGFNDCDTYCIRETWEPFVYRGPFLTRSAATARALEIAVADEYTVSIEHTSDNIA